MNTQFIEIIQEILVNGLYYELILWGTVAYYPPQYNFGSMIESELDLKDVLFNGQSIGKIDFEYWEKFIDNEKVEQLVELQL